MFNSNWCLVDKTSTIKAQDVERGMVKIREGGRIAKLEKEWTNRYWNGKDTDVGDILAAAFSPIGAADHFQRVSEFKDMMKADKDLQKAKDASRARYEFELGAAPPHSDVVCINRASAYRESGTHSTIQMEPADSPRVLSGSVFVACRTLINDT